MQRIGIIGCGYVGLVTAACLADAGSSVLCADSDKRKIAKLKSEGVPFYEPGLDELVLKNHKAKRLRFTSSTTEVVKGSDIIFICVGTPSRSDGSADLTAVEKVATDIAHAMDAYKIIVEKSTVPAETGARIRKTIEMAGRGKTEFDVVSNPEFLREGQAIHDTMHPDRIVLGVESKRAEKTLRALYAPLRAPVIVCNIATAEIIKHACNSFLATKISFINAIARICELVDADVLKVAEAMGLDKRIGPAFLNAGAGYGGSCFPKDVDAFIHLADQKGYDFELAKAVRKINTDQRTLLLKKIEEVLWNVKGKTVAVLGLSFKPDTDDLRNSVALDVVRALQEMGALVRAYDPKAVPKAKTELKSVRFTKDAYDAAKGSHCLLLMTEWAEFRDLDLGRIHKLMKQPVIVDARNFFDPETVKARGFAYRGIGRGAKGGSTT